jgi:hypothetical protein
MPLGRSPALRLLRAFDRLIEAGPSRPGGPVSGEDQ